MSSLGDISDLTAEDARRILRLLADIEEMGRAQIERLYEASPPAGQTIQVVGPSICPECGEAALPRFGQAIDLGSFDLYVHRAHAWEDGGFDEDGCLVSADD